MAHTRTSLAVVGILGVVLLAAVAHAQPASASAEVRLVDAELLNQEGVPVYFNSDVLANKIIVMDFVFTSCTTVCPVLSSLFARVQESLGERLEKEVRLVSVSLDATRDTPARLKAYAARYKARQGWTWLTGDKQDVARVLGGLGAYTPDYNNHAPMVLVGDMRTGKWVRLNGFPSHEEILAKVDELAAARRSSRAVEPSPGTGPAAQSEGKSRSYFTDAPLLTQEGKTVRFYSDVLKDRVVVISFFFTRCQTACPLLTQKLLQVKRELGERFGKEVHFISISVDPAFDTPQELKKFARRHQAEAEGWTFLTGSKEDVGQVLGRLGQTVGEVEDHTTLFIAGNVRSRHWTRLRPDSPAVTIAERLRELAERP
ncbi:SCO family protein [Cystobacter fuscus]